MPKELNGEQGMFYDKDDAIAGNDNNGETGENLVKKDQELAENVKLKFKQKLEQWSSMLNVDLFTDGLPAEMEEKNQKIQEIVENAKNTIENIIPEDTATITDEQLPIIVNETNTVFKSATNQIREILASGQSGIILKKYDEYDQDFRQWMNDPAQSVDSLGNYEKQQLYPLTGDAIHQISHNSRNQLPGHFSMEIDKLDFPYEDFLVEINKNIEAESPKNIKIYLNRIRRTVEEALETCDLQFAGDKETLIAKMAIALDSASSKSNNINYILNHFEQAFTANPENTWWNTMVDENGNKVLLQFFYANKVQKYLAEKGIVPMPADKV